MMQTEIPIIVDRWGIDDRFARRAVWLPIVTIGPFVGLLFCASPHADDFCFAAGWREAGLIAMVGELYQTFQGRLFSFVATIVPFIVHDMLGGDLLVVFRAFCAAALAATVALALWTGKVLWPAGAKSLRLLLGLTLAAVLVAGCPQPEDLLYWATGIGFYTIPALISLWMMMWLHRQAVRTARLGPSAVVVLMAGGMLIAMATEISGPVLAVIVLASLLHRSLIPGAPRQPLAHALVLCAIAIGVAVVVLAPGNALRMRQMGTDQGIALRAVAGLPMTIVHLAQFLFRRLTNPALLAWLVLLVLVVPACGRRPRDVAPAAHPRAIAFDDDARHSRFTSPWRGEHQAAMAAVFKNADAKHRLCRAHARSGGGDSPAAHPSPAVWLPLGSALIAIYGSLWIGHVATGRLLELRALNYLHFVLVGGLSLTAVAASPAFGARLRGLIGSRWPRLDGRKLAVAALLLMLATPHFLQALRILPHVVALHRLMESRFALLGVRAASGAPVADRELVLSPPSTGDTAWFGDPVSRDPDAWTNACVARYAGARSVRIATPGPSD